MVTRIYLVRHAEAEGNAEEFFQGSIDTALTARGQEQLWCLGERFRHIPLSAVYYSPFQRTMQTAQAVNRYSAAKMIPDNELREINAGKWERTKWADLPALYPGEYQKWTQEMHAFQAPDGDAMQDVYTRMQNALNRIAAENRWKTVAVVSHGCALRNFLCYVEFGDIHRLKDVGWADNTAVSLVEYKPENGWKLIYKNDADHLPEGLSTLRGSKWNRYETKTGGNAK